MKNKSPLLVLLTMLLLWATIAKAQTEPDSAELENDSLMLSISTPLSTETDSIIPDSTELKIDSLMFSICNPIPMETDSIIMVNRGSSYVKELKKNNASLIINEYVTPDVTKVKIYLNHKPLRKILAGNAEFDEDMNAFTFDDSKVEKFIYKNKPFFVLHPVYRNCNGSVCIQWRSLLISSDSKGNPYVYYFYNEDPTEISDFYTSEAGELLYLNMTGISDEDKNKYALSSEPCEYGDSCQTYIIHPLVLSKNKSWQVMYDPKTKKEYAIVFSKPDYYVVSDGEYEILYETGRKLYLSSQRNDAFLANDSINLETRSHQGLVL